MFRVRSLLFATPWIVFLAVASPRPVTGCMSPGTTPETEQTGLHRSLLTSFHFEEPLIPMCATSQKEDDSLLQAIKAYERNAKVDDFRAFDVFLSDYPRS